MSPLYIKSLYINKCIAYELREPNFNTITYGHNTLNKIINQSIRYQGSKLWNNLPNKVKMSNGLSTFKNAIQK